MSLPHDRAISNAFDEVVALLLGGDGGEVPVLRLVAAKLLEVFGGRFALVMTPDDLTAPCEMTIATAVGDIPMSALEMSIPVKGTLSGSVLLEDRDVVIADTTNEGDPARSLGQQWGVRSVMIVSIPQTGVMVVADEAELSYTNADLESARLLVRLSSLGSRIARGARAIEREAIYNAMHDGAMQLLHFAALELEMAMEATSEDARNELTTSSLAAVRECLVEMRSQAAGIERGGSLLERLNLIVERFGAHAEITVDCEGDDVPADDPYSIQFAKIALEATSNAIRHGKADRVGIALTSNEKVFRLTVEDDGVGFAPKTTRHGIGLTSMRARADDCGADLSIQSVPGDGTRIVVEHQRKPRPGGEGGDES